MRQAVKTENQAYSYLILLLFELYLYKVLHMTKIIIQIERSEDAKLLEAFANRLGLVYAYQDDSTSTEVSQMSDKEWVKAINGSWNDFPETAEEMINLIEDNRTLGRAIEML